MSCCDVGYSGSTERGEHVGDGDVSLMAVPAGDCPASGDVDGCVAGVVVPQREDRQVEHGERDGAFDGFLAPVLGVTSAEVIF